jgi:DNA-binding transcriptional LysR family regulator
MLERGRRLLADAASFGERALSLKGGHTGTLRVGAPTQVIENLLALFVPGFQKRYPGVEVHLLEAAATRLQSHVDRGDVQLGILPSGHDALLGELLYPFTLWWLWRKNIRSPAGPRSKSWSSPTSRCCYSAANLACDPGLKRPVTLPTLDHACCWRALLHTLLLHWRARGTGLRLFPLMCGSRGLMFVLCPWCIAARLLAGGPLSPGTPADFWLHTLRNLSRSWPRRFGARSLAAMSFAGYRRYLDQNCETVDFLAKVRSGSWLCKNVATRDGDRINVVPNRVEVLKDRRARSILAELRKVVLVASQFFEFRSALSELGIGANQCKAVTPWVSNASMTPLKISATPIAETKKPTMRVVASIPIAPNLSESLPA